MNRRELRLPPQRRQATFVREKADAEARTIELAFSSEEPVERWWGVEILGHGDGEVDTGWIKSGRAPLLVDHSFRDQVGVVESAELGKDRKGRATVRFGRSPRADEIFKDVLDGIRVNVSVGYEIRRALLVEEKDDLATYRIVDWKPYEISIVAAPADETVGVGRSGDADAKPVEVLDPTNEGEREMTTQTQPSTGQQPPAVNIEQVRSEALRLERERVKQIRDLAGRHQVRELGERAIDDGRTIEEFRGLILDDMIKRKDVKPLDTPPSQLDLSEREIRSYSIVRAIRAGMMQDWSFAGFEQEASREIAKKLKQDARGFFVPLDIQTSGKRDLTVSVAADGGNLKATDLKSDSFIDLLRNRMMVRQMGATVLSGLVGDIAIPKQTGPGTAYWIAESGAPTESQQTVGQIPMTPKTVAAFTDFSRKLMLQSSISVEQFVRNDLTQILALAIDLAALHGTGASNQPTGIAATAGIGSVVGGTNGLAPTWGHVVSLETEVAVDNADIGSLGYLTNAKVRGKLKQTEKAVNTGMFIWGDNQTERGFGMLNGYRAGASNQVRSDLTKGTSTGVCSAIFFGNWADQLIAEWGILDILVNPYTGADSGTVRVHAFESVDIALRRAESFAAMLDALTT